MKTNKTFKQKIWHFLEESSGAATNVFHSLIILLIIASSAFAIIELAGLKFFNLNFIIWFEYFVLGVFTAEFAVRLWASPSKSDFLKDKYNFIDFLAIAPFYFGLHSLVVLRTLRLLRLFKLIKFFSEETRFNVFQVRGTILEKISPLLITFLIAKIIIWILEVNSFWFRLENLELLFTIIGFALGIILSQKIGTTYGKYLELERGLFEIHGKLLSLKIFLNSIKKDFGIYASRRWLKGFLDAFHGPDDEGVRKLSKTNESFYQDVYLLGDSKLIPHYHLCYFLSDLFKKANVVISRKASYTPGAYDKLLQQVTLIYLVLIIIFFPGFNGVISVFIGTYLLYGMYYVTQDFDMAIGRGKSNLIILSPHRLENFLDDLERESKGGEVHKVSEVYKMRNS